MQLRTYALHATVDRKYINAMDAFQRSTPIGQPEPAYSDIIRDAVKEYLWTHGQIDVEKYDPRSQSRLASGNISPNGKVGDKEILNINEKVNDGDERLDSISSATPRRAR